MLPASQRFPPAATSTRNHGASPTHLPPEVGAVPEALDDDVEEAVVLARLVGQHWRGKLWQLIQALRVLQRPLLLGQAGLYRQQGMGSMCGSSERMQTGAQWKALWGGPGHSAAAAAWWGSPAAAV